MDSVALPKCFFCLIDSGIQKTTFLQSCGLKHPSHLAFPLPPFAMRQPFHVFSEKNLPPASRNPPFSGKSIGGLHRPQVCQQGWGKNVAFVVPKIIPEKGRCNLRLFGKKYLLCFFPGNSRFVASLREVEAFFSKFATQCYARMMKRGMREALQDSSRGQRLTIATGKLEKSMIK